MYKNFYKLKGKPFGLNPEPKYFFNSTTHKQAFQCIGSGLEKGQGFITIAGGPGSGKTTLASGLEYMLAKTDVITGYIQNTMLQSEDLLRYILAELDLPFEEDSKVVLLNTMEDFFDHCRQQHQRVVLIVDDAHNLSQCAIEELKMTLNLFQRKKPVLQFVLLGQFELNSLSPSDTLYPLLQKVVASYRLTNLDELESKAYITHRLRIAGWKGDPEISANAFTSIYEHTLGNPGEINMLCLRVLESACHTSARTIDRHLVQWVVQEVVQQQEDVDFSGTMLEKLVIEQFEEEGAYQERDISVPELPSEEQNFPVYYEIEEKSDAEKEETIGNWLTRKRKKKGSEIGPQLSEQELDIIGGEVKDLLDKLETSNISKLFPEGAEEVDIEETIN